LINKPSKKFPLLKRPLSENNETQLILLIASLKVKPRVLKTIKLPFVQDNIVDI